MNSFLNRLDHACRGFALAVAATLCAIGTVSAHSADGDPPDRVARIAETYGQVWLYSPDAGEWITALRNRPVTSGDRLATDTGGRVELTLGSTTLRLDAGSELEVLRLDDNRVALQLHNGSAAVRIRDARAVGEFEMTTLEGRFRVQTAGRYRFDRFDRASHVTVYAGQASFEGRGSALTVYSGQRGEFWIEGNGVAQYSLTEPVRDAFAGWLGERERNEDRIASTQRYVSPEMTGAQDLDRYGRWEQSPDYGPVWYPRAVASGWAPYSSGHWAWVRPWGWTWVDDAPWGFAPFHYGRWVYYRDAWGWTPGAFAARPVYAPALVAWVGGPRVNVSVSIGGAGPAVGWFPLAPREVYVPSYAASPGYVREVNITHVTNITNITNVVNNPPLDYSNRKYPHAVTVVPTSVMMSREPVGPSAARLRDLAPVRALVSEPGRSVAIAPIAAPTPAQRGVDSRPFHPPEVVGNRPPRGPGIPTPVNATEEARRGPAERASVARPPMNATEEAQHGPASLVPAPVARAPLSAAEEARLGPAGRPSAAPSAARPPMNATEEARQGPAERAPVTRPPMNASEEARHGAAAQSPIGSQGGRFERRGGAQALPPPMVAPQVQPAAVAPPVPVRPAAAPAPAVPPPPPIAPATRIVPPSPAQGTSPSDESQRRAFPHGEREGRRDPRPEQSREVPQRAAPAQRPETVQGVAPPAARAAPPSLQVMPRPVRVEPAAPVVRPAEAPRPASEARGPERRPEAPVRDERKEAGPARAAP